MKGLFRRISQKTDFIPSTQATLESWGFVPYGNASDNITTMYKRVFDEKYDAVITIDTNCISCQYLDSECDSSILHIAQPGVEDTIEQEGNMLRTFAEKYPQYLAPQRPSRNYYPAYDGLLPSVVELLVSQGFVPGKSITADPMVAGAGLSRWYISGVGSIRVQVQSCGLVIEQPRVLTPDMDVVYKISTPPLFAGMTGHDFEIHADDLFEQYLHLFSVDAAIWSEPTLKPVLYQQENKRSMTILIE